MANFIRTTLVVDTNDEGLRQLTYERGKVFVKFTADNCAICKMLEPGFVKFAADGNYEGVLFVRLASDENPVAKQLMNERATPFFVSYCNGRIIECNTLETNADMQAQLDRLHALVLPTT